MKLLVTPENVRKGLKVISVDGSFSGEVLGFYSGIDGIVVVMDHTNTGLRRCCVGFEKRYDLYIDDTICVNPNDLCDKCLAKLQDGKK